MVIDIPTLNAKIDIGEANSRIVMCDATGIDDAHDNAENGNTFGGGEVLQYYGESPEVRDYKRMDNSLIGQFGSIQQVKIGIGIFLVILCAGLILRLFKVRSLFRDKGIASELRNVHNIKDRDKQIVTANKLLAGVTNRMMKTSLKHDKNRYDYLQYNLKRARVMAPGGYRVMTPDEFQACIKLLQYGFVFLSMVILIFMNMTLGAIILVLSVIACNIIPMRIIRMLVTSRDAEIQKNFMYYYLMLHYVLISGAQTPLSKIMRSYAKTTDSNEMRFFVDNCVSHIDTMGEYRATRLISDDYREIPEVSRLMRLIRQSQDGGNIEEELIGFRQSLIKDLRFQMETYSNKLVSRARNSFNMLMIILIQAVASAAAIYLPDMGSITSIF